MKVVACLPGLAVTLAAASAPAAETGFTPLFDGRSIASWEVSAKTGHSGASGHTTGGRWVIEDGAIVGSQDVPGNGGLLLTTESFGDFEVALEMKNDFGPDSGLFLRSAGWMNSDRTAPRTGVEDGALNPHRAGHYMLVYTQQWSDFSLALDFKIPPRCNSGVFVRTAPLEPRPGKDVGFNGLEIAIDDTMGAGFHDTGALYDLARPGRNAMRPVGEWNHLEITCRGRRIAVVLNGVAVNAVDLGAFARPNRRPDGSEHKFDIAYRDHPQTGYIGLQDHGSPCWFKNIKLLPLTAGQ